MSEHQIRSGADLSTILDRIVLAPSGARLDAVAFEVVDAHVGGTRGWAIRAVFSRPDRDTGKVGVGAGRWEFVASGASETAVVKTAWLLCELLVRHELMESFTYRGARIFDPHHTVDELSLAHAARGGR